MQCPVCKTECGENTECSFCGFGDVNRVFINRTDAEIWKNETLLPYKQQYYLSLVEKKILKIKGTELKHCYVRAGKKVVIPDFITTISHNAFSSNGKLVEIYLPNDIKELPDNVFDGCFSLENIHLPENLEQIPPFAFQHCWNLKEVYIPNGVRTIAPSAFALCKKLRRLHIEPDNKFFRSINDCIIDSLGTLVFAGSGALPNDGSIKKIIGCSLNYLDMTTLEIPEGVVEISGELFFHPIYCCPNLKIIVLPNSLEIINEAIIECDALERITIPKNVRYISTGTFSRAIRHCKSLSKIEVDNHNKTFYSRDNCVIERNTKKLVLAIATSKIPRDGSVVCIGKSAFHSIIRELPIIIPRTILFMEFAAFVFCDCDIFCEAEYKPNGWSNNWCSCHNANIYWGNEWHYEIGKPVINDGMEKERPEELPF